MLSSLTWLTEIEVVLLFMFDINENCYFFWGYFNTHSKCAHFVFLLEIHIGVYRCNSTSSRLWFSFGKFMKNDGVWSQLTSRTWLVVSCDVRLRGSLNWVKSLITFIVFVLSRTLMICNSSGSMLHQWVGVFRAVSKASSGR